MIRRRELLKAMGGYAAGLLLLPEMAKPASNRTAARFEYCLNMATIRGHNLGWAKELEVASKAGFRAVEIWIDSLQTWIDKGGKLTEAKKMLDDLGLRVENSIGFAEWIVDEPARRSKGLEQMKKEMGMLATIGCKRTAAPPAGATDTPGLDLRKAAERYRAILQLGVQSGVIPHLELWGFSKNCGRLSEVMYVALESGHPSAKVLLDIFHLYKGGSSLETLPLVSNTAVEILHLNDYLANTPAATITDADRIFPGDGVAPIRQVLQSLQHPSKPLILSVEVFNKAYYSQDPLKVAKTALDKMKEVAG